MIKKLFFILIAAFGIYGAYVCYANGFEMDIKFAQLDIPSYSEVKQNKEKLDKNVKELNKLNSSGISTALSGVEAEVANYEAKKQEYDMLALSASREEIAEANKIEKYLLDYLWIKVGNYASDNKVKFKMTPNEVDASLTFDITGPYISVINFIYDIENDVELNFGINGIVMEGASSGTVKANFKVEDINVVTSPDEAVTTEW